MTRIKLAFVHEYTDRHGKIRRYVRQHGRAKVALPGLPGSPEFMDVYQSALAGPAKPPNRHKPGTLGALTTEFFGSAEYRNLAVSSQATYRVALNPILVRDGHRMVRDLPPDKARKIIQEIGARRPGMANLTRSVLKRLMKFAIGMNWRSDNPFAAVPMYKLGTHHTWSDEELAAYEARWPLGTRERLAYDLLLWTGQRVGDVTRMRRADMTGGAIHLVQAKTGAELYIAIHPALARAMKAGPNNGLHLIGDAHGRPLKRARLSELIVRAARAAGLPPECVAHGLRKAALRRLAEHGSSAKQMQAVSGHRTLGEIERYTRQADQRKLAKAAIRRIPDKGRRG